MLVVIVSSDRFVNHTYMVLCYDFQEKKRKNIAMPKNLVMV